MKNSISAQMTVILDQLFDLNRQFSKLVEQMPTAVKDTHSLATCSVLHGWMATYELRNAMRVWEADQDSLDQCTEQELVKVELIGYCASCGLRITNRVGSFVRDNEGNVYCTSCANDLSEDGKNVHMSPMSYPDPS